MDGLRQQMGGQLQGIKQTPGLFGGIACYSLALAGGEIQRTEHVIQHAQKGQQIELLKYVADMVGAEFVASAAGEGAKRVIQHLEGAAAGSLDAAEQAQQGGFTRA